jgi:hypothetical protein
MCGADARPPRLNPQESVIRAGSLAVSLTSTVLVPTELGVGVAVVMVTHGGHHHQHAAEGAEHALRLSGGPGADGGNVHDGTASTPGHFTRRSRQTR